jgi:hypothetical protein
MMASTNKVRLVVGLFSTAEGLASGLALLAASQLPPERIRVIAQANALDGALQRWSGTAEAQAFATWVVCRPVDGPFPWALAAADPDRPISAAAEQDARALLGFHHWALRRQAQQLDRHLRAGGALLLAEPDTDAEERSACTALLRHASGGVQTHEVARVKGS